MSKYNWSVQEMLNKGKTKECFKRTRFKYDVNDHRVLASMIFSECFRRILLDCIENNVTFVVPFGSKSRLEIYVRSYEGEEFKNMREIGFFENIDFVKSQFTGHLLRIKLITSKGKIFDRRIYIDPNLRKMLEDNTNSGKVYY
jgi:hypothetical protein